MLLSPCLSLIAVRDLLLMAPKQELGKVLGVLVLIFTGLPLRGLLGNLASGELNSRKLSVYLECQDGVE
jgi:hypothetical protein